MAITAMYAEFKTAWNQREVRLDAKPATNLHVGQICTYTPSSKALTAKTSGTVAVGDVIIAQSDMTTGRGHVPIEYRDHDYADVVAQSATEKLVMVFVVNDVTDIISRNVESA